MIVLLVLSNVRFCSTTAQFRNTLFCMSEYFAPASHSSLGWRQ